MALAKKEKEFKTTKAYHYTDGSLRNGSLPRIGKWLEHSGPVEICKSGLHASRHPFDALRYAPGSYLHLVEVDDIVAEEEDKLVCRRRKILKTIQADRINRRFACECAALAAWLVGIDTEEYRHAIEGIELWW